MTVRTYYASRASAPGRTQYLTKVNFGGLLCHRADLFDVRRRVPKEKNLLRLRVEPDWEYGNG